MKLSNSAVFSPVPLGSAVQGLRSSVPQPEAHERLQRRLREVQSLLGDELGWVEAELARAASNGLEPSVSAARHLLSHGGKRIRPVALLLSAACFGPIPKAARELSVVAELVHSATLLHDDVVDEGLERRGAPAARRIWGNAVSVLAGDLLLVHALERTLTHAPEVLPDLVLTLRRLIDGEVIQLRGRNELDVREATYERILRDKTASLFAFATRTGARLGGAESDAQVKLGEFGELLGVAFQLVDDVLDYQGEGTGKHLFQDLHEGKLTLPLVLAVQETPELLELLKRVFDGDTRLARDVSDAVIRSGACAEVRRRAIAATRQAIELLSVLPDSRARGLLEVVALELVERVG